MLDRRGFSGAIAEAENLIKGDLIPMSVRGGHSNDLMVVESVDCGMLETTVSGFLIWEASHVSVSVPAFTKVEVWNS